MKRNKKKKLKAKNLIVFLICLLLIVFSITYGIKSLTKKKTTSTEETKTNKSSLEIEGEKLKYYHKKYKDRYESYYKKNKDLSIEQVITNVNIGLDQEYYTNTKESEHLNDITILVNKYNYLSEDYVPDNLEDINLKYAKSGMKLVNYAKDAFETMAEAATKENMQIIAMSSYRSYAYQTTLYDRYKAKDGQEAADTYSARAGFSEHQTGLAVDIYNGKQAFEDFEDTKEFDWMQENASKYGFILRFPKDKVNETGYMYESWHYRYVGKKVAEYIKNKHITYDEYYVQEIEK